MSKKIEIERTHTSFRLPTELMRQIKVRCALEDLKINDYVVGLIEKDMEKWKARNPKMSA